MFKSVVPLQAKTHPDLRMVETNSYGYAARELIVPVVIDEIADIAREYAIIFPDNGTHMPGALLGVETGVNAHVAEDGRWLATYVPSFIRRYPFALADVTAQSETPDGQRKFAVVFDPDAPHFKESNGYPVFDAGGAPSEHMKKRLAFLETLQKRAALTRHLVERLEATDLLIPRSIRISRAGAEDSQLSGLRVVDERKLNSLGDDDFLALRKAGVLPLIYAHLLSMANLRQGIIGGRYRIPAAGQAGPKLAIEDVLDTATPELDIDWARFEDKN